MGRGAVFVRARWRSALGSAITITIAIVVAVHATSTAAASHSGTIGQATIALGAAVPVPIGESGGRALRDPRGGGWVVGRGELFRLGEDGSVEKVELPTALRGPQLTLTPLKSGWDVASARVFPGGRREEENCLSRIPFGRCGVVVVAQLSAKGRWTRARRLPHSSGSDSSGFEDPPEVVERGGRIEIAWCRECLGGGQPGWIASARPGGRFGRPYRVQHLPHIKPELGFEGVETFRGNLYIRAQFGPHGLGYSGRHVVERGPDRELSLNLLHRRTRIRLASCRNAAVPALLAHVVPLRIAPRRRSQPSPGVRRRPRRLSSGMDTRGEAGGHHRAPELRVSGLDGSRSACPA